MEDAIFIKSQFDFVVYAHIYMEKNEVVDILSKEPAQLIRGHWLIQEYRDGFFFSDLPQTLH